MKTKGFTLVESLMVMTLVSVVLVVSGGLIRDYSRTSRRAKIDPVQELLQSAIPEIERDIRGAHRLLLGASPSFPATIGSTLNLERIQIEAPGRYPSTLVPAPASWAGEDPAHTSQIEFRLDNRQLIREERRQSQTFTERMAKDVETLNFSMPSSRILEAEIQIIDQNGTSLRIQKQIFLTEGIQF